MSYKPSPIKVNTVENGFLVEIDGKQYAIEGTDEDFIKWWRAFRDNERLEFEKRRQLAGTAALMQDCAKVSASAIARELDKNFGSGFDAKLSGML